MQRWIIFKREFSIKRYVLHRDKDMSWLRLIPSFKTKEQAKEYLKKYLRRMHDSGWDLYYKRDYKIVEIEWPGWDESEECG